MMDLHPGLYVLAVDKTVVSQKIDCLSKVFNKTLDDNLAVAESKACRRKIVDILEKNFVDTRARAITIRSLKASNMDNPYNARKYADLMNYILIGLKNVVDYSFCFKDLPSCRSLLDCCLEEVQEKAIDLVGHGVIKDITKTLIIGKNLYHFKEIADVKRYYSDMLALFTADSAAGMQPTPIEQVFDLKCREELVYCQMASLKEAGKLTKELYEKGKEEVEALEKQYKNFGRYGTFGV